MFWPFTVRINWISDLKISANSLHKAPNFKSVLDHYNFFFLTEGQQSWKQNTISFNTMQKNLTWLNKKCWIKKNFWPSRNIWALEVAIKFTKNSLHFQAGGTMERVFRNMLISWNPSRFRPFTHCSRTARWVYDIWPCYG